MDKDQDGFEDRTNKIMDVVYSTAGFAVATIGMFTGVITPVPGVILILGAYAIFNGESVAEIVSKVK
jgi:xanthosine utilization system XapX-like protein